MEDEEEKGGEAKLDVEEELNILSKVVKSGSVETFNWEFTDRKWIRNRQSDQTITKKVENLQAILINPKWAEHGFDTLADSPNNSGTPTQDSDENAAANRKGKKGGKKPQQQHQTKEDFSEHRSAYSGLRIEELKKLVIPPDVMREGMLFIWAEKELIGEILDHFEP